MRTISSRTLSQCALGGAGTCCFFNCRKLHSFSTLSLSILSRALVVFSSASAVYMKDVIREREQPSEEADTYIPVVRDEHITDPLLLEFRAPCRILDLAERELDPCVLTMQQCFEGLGVAAASPDAADARRPPPVLFFTVLLYQPGGPRLRDGQARRDELLRYSRKMMRVFMALLVESERRRRLRGIRRGFGGRLDQ